MINTSVDIEAAICALDDLRKPWTVNSREECPEEAAVGLPVQFEWAQSFIGKTYEEAVAEYKGLWNTHISECMRADTHHCIA